MAVTSLETTNMPARFWTVVLAAGAGRRVSAVTGGVPKQFWRNGRGPSLLEETVARFAPLSTPARTVVVIDAAHRRYLRDGAVPAAAEAVIVQPADRGTANGVLLALTPVLEADPDAVVVLTPADHGVVDGARLRAGIVEGARHVLSTGEIVLFGVQPTVAHDDYGWITPARNGGGTLRPVASFVEKPTRDVAASLLASGSIWNTMILVARARALGDLFGDLLPDLAEVFQMVVRLPAVDRTAFLADIYRELPSVDFSRDVLARASALSTYVLPASVGWSDLGTPERLRAWQDRSATGRQSAVITAA
jgi:mannose-1-phosphate guanylyltransferase